MKLSDIVIGKKYIINSIPHSSKSSCIVSTVHRIDTDGEVPFIFFTGIKGYSGGCITVKDVDNVEIEELDEVNS